jgi:methylglutamate dehydrogenase subunit B
VQALIRGRIDSLLLVRDDIAMMLIPCPWCGVRNQIEFTYGGDATLRRPAPGGPESAWVDYVYLRDNRCGPHDELWYHGAGCRSWFKVRRDTRTHQILASASIDQPPPAES